MKTGGEAVNYKGLRKLNQQDLATESKEEEEAQEDSAIPQRQVINCWNLEGQSDRFSGRVSHKFSRDKDWGCGTEMPALFFEHSLYYSC